MYRQSPRCWRALVNKEGRKENSVKGKQADGSAKTREAKVIAAFTADWKDPKTGLPVTDTGSDRVGGSIGSAATGWRTWCGLCVWRET